MQIVQTAQRYAELRGQATAPNSGGALADLSGQVIGTPVVHVAVSRTVTGCPRRTLCSGVTRAITPRGRVAAGVVIVSSWFSFPAAV
jgi:hypothetical protein